MTGHADECDSSQVYLEGDVSINSYVDAEGNTKSSLNVVQRKDPLSCQQRTPVTDPHRQPRGPQAQGARRGRRAAAINAPTAAQLAPNDAHLSLQSPLHETTSLC